MKKQKCQLILHGSSRQLHGGEFESISAAKKWVSECWSRPYTIVKIKSK